MNIYRKLVWRINSIRLICKQCNNNSVFKSGVHKSINLNAIRSGINKYLKMGTNTAVMIYLHGSR